MASRPFRLRLEPYNPDARDADGDGIVQENTAWERPAGTRIFNELGQELSRGLFSSRRMENFAVVDTDGRSIDYVPSYAKQANIPTERPKTSLEKRGVRTIKSMGIPSIGEMLGSNAPDQPRRSLGSDGKPQPKTKRRASIALPARRTKPVSLDGSRSLRDFAVYGDSAGEYRKIVGEESLRAFRGQLEQEKESLAQAYATWKTTGEWRGATFGVSAPRAATRSRAIQRDLSVDDLAQFGTKDEVEKRFLTYIGAVDTYLDDVDRRLESIERAKQGIIEPEITDVELRDHPEFETFRKRGREIIDTRREIGERALAEQENNVFIEPWHDYFFHVGASDLEGGVVDPNFTGSREIGGSKTTGINSFQRTRFINEFEYDVRVLTEIDQALADFDSTGSWAPSSAVANLTFPAVDKAIIDAQPNGAERIRERIILARGSLQARVDNPERRTVYDAMKSGKQFTSLTAYHQGPWHGYRSGSQEGTGFHLLRVPKSSSTDLLSAVRGGEFGEYQTWEAVAPILSIRVDSDAQMADIADATIGYAERFIDSRNASPDETPADVVLASGSLGGTLPDPQALASMETASKLFSDEVLGTSPDWGAPTDQFIESLNGSSDVILSRTLRTRDERLARSKRFRRDSIEKLKQQLASDLSGTGAKDITSIPPEVREFILNASVEEIEAVVEETALRVAQGRQRAPRVWAKQHLLDTLLTDGYKPSADSVAGVSGRFTLETELGASPNAPVRPVYGFSWFDFWDDRLEREAEASGKPWVSAERMISVSGDSRLQEGPGKLASRGSEAYGNMELILSDAVGDRTSIHHRDSLLQPGFGAHSVNSSEDELISVFSGGENPSDGMESIANLVTASMTGDLSVWNSATGVPRYTESIILGGFDSRDVRAIKIEGTRVRPDYKTTLPDGTVVGTIEPVKYMEELLDKWVDIRLIRETYGAEIAADVEDQLKEIVQGNQQVEVNKLMGRSGSSPALLQIVSLDSRRRLRDRINKNHPHIRVIYGSISGADPDDPRTYGLSPDMSLDSHLRARLLSELVGSAERRIEARSGQPFDEDESVA